MTENDIKKSSLAGLREMHGRGELYHDPNAPEGDTLDGDFWKTAVLKEPLAKKSISLRVDRDVLDWYKAQGEGYQTRMNAVLRSYMESLSTSRR
ncbi:BrnA antitoxin family protein [Pelagibacterium luteolum]|uniref:BrnA antitoxin of type II toxin-antitoxin system n=1 Tax=Pelagibacterium luteolum TaxID=440168 RepID=A0A1G7SDP1_9HYPH|nr:BrnA antitoxin family protein [Pelagibacterium luteolum]SDG21177.1 BrnA antitoxin of type II toxin-antitoxin system [Pelagibacterium luteolum]